MWPALVLLPLLLMACPTKTSPVETGESEGPCTFYVDADGDGFGDVHGGALQADCGVAPSGYVEDATDCDDASAAIHPGAEEECDEEDNDCDGQADEEAVDAPTWYADTDGDHFGADTVTTAACEMPEGHAPEAGDCDDADPTVYPTAGERCDGLDNDCDLLVDEDLTRTWYADGDADGFGDAATSTSGCDPGPGWVTDATDCDDTSPVRWPGAPETCDGLDNDCDGLADEDLSSTWYADLDGDGFGDPATVSELCAPGAGWVDDASDCDDHNSDIHPAAAEVCDRIDNDCDGWMDDEDDLVEGTSTWYRDADADGWGTDADTADACLAPSGYAPWSGDCDDADPAFHPGADESDCTDPTDYNCDGSTGFIDGDLDGWAACAECDDTDGSIHPGAPESCDGRDQDCDGDVDEDAVDAPTWYADVDGDGWGDSTEPLRACDATPGWVADASGGLLFDCDDTLASVHPEAPETCNGQDDDCDGAADEDLSSTWYADGDGDGWGDASLALTSCDPGEGWVAVGSDGAFDCDDGSAAVFPGALEVCDTRDDDCDGLVDEGLTSTWYLDADGDGYGDPSMAGMACAAPTGWVADGSDCDDTWPLVFPGAAETCDGLDDDCDGLVDDDDPDVTGQSTWYADGDGDGWGADGWTALACVGAEGQVLLAGDCDDADPAFHPGAPEDDCVDPSDYNCDGATGWADADLDGWAACEECDEGDAASFPGATERCDGKDNDCDGIVDEDDAVDAATWYVDGDADGWGDPLAPQTACAAPSGTVGVSGDCDDHEAATFPGAAEACDGVDQDCDGDSDEGVTLVLFQDLDGDGFGNGSVTSTGCAASAGWVADATDCDDLDTSAYPGATEVCDGGDNDCDGAVDEASAADARTWYRDSDRDGWGSATRTMVACAAPSGYVAEGTDCNDGRSDIYPGAAEMCDGADGDCDGSIDEDALDADPWYVDADADGWGDGRTATLACAAPSDHVAVGDDCDDLRSDIHPGAAEVCDGQDNDCDGVADEEDAEDISLWYADADGDGYGDPATSAAACSRPDGWVSDRTDCDDTRAESHPRASEVCDELDNDCDGSVDEGATAAPTWYGDRDGDGYGDPSLTRRSCDMPSGYVSNAMDCDDGDGTNHPGAVESCDDVDNDCDDEVDEPDEVSDPTYFYPDEDNDGWGSDHTATLACEAPDGWVDTSTDCDDEDAHVYPTASDVCDGLDNDCDGVVDPDPEPYDSDGDGVYNCMDSSIYSYNYNDGAWTGWTWVDLGGGNVPSWYMSSGTLHEGSNAANSIAVGPDLGPLYRYEVAVDIQSSGLANNAAAIVVGYQDTSSYLMARWLDPNDYYGSYANHGRVDLYLCDGGYCSVLATDDGTRDLSKATGVWVQMVLTVDWEEVTVTWDGMAVASATLTFTPMGADHVGVYTWDNDGGIYYDNFQVLGL